MDRLAWPADQSVNQHVPSTAAHSAFYLPQDSAIPSEAVVHASPLPFFAVALLVGEVGRVINDLKCCYKNQFSKCFKGSHWSPVVLPFMQKKWCFCWRVTPEKFRPTSRIFLLTKRFAFSSWASLHSADCEKVCPSRWAEPPRCCQTLLAPVSSERALLRHRSDNARQLPPGSRSAHLKGME